MWTQLHPNSFLLLSLCLMWLLPSHHLALDTEIQHVAEKEPLWRWTPALWFCFSPLSVPLRSNPSVWLHSANLEPSSPPSPPLSSLLDNISRRCLASSYRRDERRRSAARLIWHRSDLRWPLAVSRCWLTPALGGERVVNPVLSCQTAHTRRDAVHPVAPGNPVVTSDDVFCFFVSNFNTKLCHGNYSKTTHGRLKNVNLYIKVNFSFKFQVSKI